MTKQITTTYLPGDATAWKMGITLPYADVGIRSRSIVATPTLLTKFAVQVDTPPGGGKSCLWTVEKNDVPTQLKVLISDLATFGEDVDPTHSVSVTAGDVLAFSYSEPTPFLNPTHTHPSGTLTFVNTNVGETNVFGAEANVIYNGTRYAGLFNATIVDAVDSLATGTRSVCPCSGTIKGLCVYTPTPGIGKSYIIHIYKNGVDQGEIVQISDNEIYKAGTCNIAVNAGDMLTFQTSVVNNPYTPAWTHFGVLFSPTINGQSIMKGGVSHQPIDGYFNFIEGGIAPLLSATEAHVASISYAVKLKNLYIVLSNAPGVGNSWTFTVRKNGIDTALSVIISGTDTTGNISADVQVADYDKLSIGEVSTGTPDATLACHGITQELALPVPIESIYRRYNMPTSTLVNAFSRLWLIENRAGPGNPPSFEGCWSAGKPSWSLGDVTPIYCPSEQEYGHFDVAGKILGGQGSPNLAVTARYRADALSTLLRLARLGCDHDLQIHFGACQDPQDFNGGWQKILLLEAARPTEWSSTEMGAMSPGDQSPVNEEVPFSGEKLYEIVRIVYAEQAEAQVVQKVVDIEVCDRISCGACGVASDGCQVVFGLTLTVGGSPGLQAELLYTVDGGENWYDTPVSSLAINEDPNALDCVGVNVVVISEDSVSLHWASIADILAGTEVWTEEATGFVAAKGPLAIYSHDPRHTWIVGEAGYIYFTDDPVLGVVVQDAGIATAQDLNAVHAYDSLQVVAVGASNAVVVTRNGGETWAALLGPAPGVDLTTVWMKGPDEWFVGDAGGNLWYTLDGGASWIQKEFYGDGSGTVTDIKFSSDTVGWMSHDDRSGRIFRTIDGGYSWYVTPEGNTSLPSNDEILALAPCEDVNVIYGAGLADDGLDGIIVKGEGG